MTKRKGKLSSAGAKTLTNESSVEPTLVELEENVTKAQADYDRQSARPQRGIRSGSSLKAQHDRLQAAQMALSAAMATSIILDAVKDAPNSFESVDAKREVVDGLLNSSNSRSQAALHTT